MTGNDSNTCGCETKCMFPSWGLARLHSVSRATEVVALGGASWAGPFTVTLETCIYCDMTAGGKCPSKRNKNVTAVGQSRGGPLGQGSGVTIAAQFTVTPGLRRPLFLPALRTPRPASSALRPTIRWPNRCWTPAILLALGVSHHHLQSPSHTEMPHAKRPH